ncbi:hypothetical protein [Moraxella catarrhalis]|uniref:hypothetical protein n=1 Tax=Moraxella catarrhalis TaxID=480 RepID=UPI001884619E|nr:hypothetical protein [Moraxella catarrhalis]
MSLCDCVPTRQANKLNLMGGRLQVWICWVVLVLGKWQAWRLLSKWADLWRFILFDKMLF